MPVPRQALRQSLRAIACAVAFAGLGASSAGAVDLPGRGADLDLAGAPRVEALTARWFFSPTDIPGAEQAILAGLAGVSRVAILTLFDDRWILQAPADSAGAVVASWAGLGELRADVSGEAALATATGLIGAGQLFIDDLDFAGDVGSTVAILDSGCDTAHDDLGDLDQDNEDGFPVAGDAGDWANATNLFAGELGFRVVGWHDVTDDLPLAVGPWDDHFHGTAMASAGFGAGMVVADKLGVAPEGRFVVVKTWNFEGRWERWASDFFLGVEWLLENADRLRLQACVVGTVWEEDFGFGPAIDALADAGIMLIAPAGNSGGRMGWPARIPEAYAVGAATKTARVASYSSYAPSLVEPPMLDAVAPGGSLLAAGGEVVVADNEPDDSYRGRVGTSIAAAMVGGAVSVLAEAARETGAFWPEGPDRVTWLTDLLNFTSVELAAAEPGSAGVPPRNRGGLDPFEGHGLIQVRAAVQAIDNIVWPGDQVLLGLSDPTEGPAAWAARIPGAADAPLTISLLPGAGVDADLFVYEDTGKRLVLVGSSTTAGEGSPESVSLDRPPASDLVAVARRVSGVGSLIFNSLQRFGPSSVWPRELRSRQTTAPVTADLDGDGTQEVILTNSFAADRRIHEFVVYDARGRTFRFFPRSVDTSPFPGRLSSPVVGEVGGRRILAASSNVGRVFGVSDSAQVLFSTPLSPAKALTAPVIYEEGPDGLLLFGGQTGIYVVDLSGQIVDFLVLPDPVIKDLAVGDLDGDSVEEIVVVTDGGAVHALEIDGSELPGWPFLMSGDPGAPILIGSAGAAGVARIIVPETTSSGELRLHDLLPSGGASAGSPVTLDRSGFALLASSPIAAARSGGSQTEVVLGAAMGSWVGDQVYRLWRYTPESGSTVFDDLTYSEQRLSAMLHFSRGLILDEPRLVDLSSAPGLEALQMVQLDWNESFVGNPRRYGSSRQYYTWFSDAGAKRTALGAGHQSFPEVWGQTPVVTDLEYDGFPDLLVVRDNRIYRTTTRMRWTLDGMWAAARGDRTRSGCLDCDGPTFVEAPARTRDLRVSVSPNPFNPRTVLTARIPEAGELRWGIFDARGRRVRAWTEFVATAGLHRATFDGTDQRGNRLSSGVYFVQLHYGKESARARMVLVR